VGRYGRKQLQRQLPEVDIILPQDKMHELGPRLAQALGPAEETPSKQKIDYRTFSEATRIQQGYAFVKIAEGCDRACSFCVIPQIRGRQQSLPPQRVEQLIQQKINLGIKEINLIAQDSANYGHDLNPRANLAQLIQRIAPLPGLHWLRLLYLNPDRITDELMDTMASHSSIVPYLDIPMQHASGKILRRMNRPGEASYFLELIAKLRHKIPEIKIRSSFIIGYPDETEQDFQKLLSFVQKAQLDRVGFFLYSDEEGSSSYEQHPKVPEKIRQQRYEAIFETQRQISHEKMSQLVGRHLELLISEQTDEEYLARTQWDAPEVDGAVFLRSKKPLATGDIITAEITGHLDYDLFAEN
jgi:ribosomal protein S12 methylthiotransferase